MSTSEILNEFNRLSADERLELIHTLWDSFVDSGADELPITPRQRDVLRERQAFASANPSAGRPWRDVLDDVEREL